MWWYGCGRGGTGRGLSAISSKTTNKYGIHRTRPFARTNRPFARMFFPSFYHVNSEKLSRFGNIAMHPPLLPPLIPHIAATIHSYEHIYSTNMHRSYVPSQRTEIALPVYDDRSSADTRRKFDSMIASEQMHSHSNIIQI